MSDGGWYGYPAQEPDPYAQPQDEWNRSPLEYGNAAQAPGYEGYDPYGRPAQPSSQSQQSQQSAQAQYYAQQQAAQQAEQAARLRAQQQQQQQYGARQPQQPAAQNPYFQQQPQPQHPQPQRPQNTQQNYGYDTGSYPAGQQYSTGGQPRVGYEGYPQQSPQSGYDTGGFQRQSGYERTGYDTATGHPNQGYESAANYEQAAYGSGSYDAAAARQAAGRRGPQRGAGTPERPAARDPYADLAEPAEEPDEYEYPNRAGRRRAESTGRQARVEDESGFDLLDREERAATRTASTSARDEDDDEDDEGEDGERKKKGRRSCLVIFLFFALIAGGLGYGGYQGYKYYESHYGPPADYSSSTGIAQVAIVVVPQNASGSEIGARLFDAGVIKSQRAFTDACNANSQCGTIQAATYQLHKQMSAAGALTALLNPANIYNKAELLVRPGERAADVFADLEQKKNWTQAQILSAINGGQVDLPSYATAKAGTKYPFANIEGLLFTGTYQLSDYNSPTALIKSMVDQQLAMFNAIGLTEKAKSLNLTPYQVLTVASMARAEAGSDPADLGKIAGVIYNRLKNPNYSKLGFDTSTLYGLGRTSPQPTAAELADKSNPYNLRVIAGLPPGPIDSVDQMALTSALAPTDSTDVFFCAVNGTVHYAANNTAWANLGKQFPGSCG